MSSKTNLLMFAATSLLAPVALEGAAEAGGKTMTAVMLPRPVEDTAPTANGRLRRTNEEQAGMEMSTFVLFGDKKSGIYFSMATELPPLTAGGPVRRAPDRVQLAAVPFVLEQAPDGSVTAKSDLSKSQFVTNNDGNEYRNANHPHAFALDGTKACVEYNHQPQNSNDTRRYLQCFDQTGANILPQTQIFAKNNDDASMNASGRVLELTKKVGNKFHLVAWRGANGNGRDDGWLQAYNLEETGTGLKFNAEFDVSLCPREERSHGNCSVAEGDPNTAICTWTEGNTQPQRDGTWIAAVDITPGKFAGADRQASILWKSQVDGRKDSNGVRTYSMRAHHERIRTLDPATGAMVRSDQLLWYSNDLRGNNNDNRTGGTVYAINMAVIKADKNGMSFVQPLTNMSNGLRGLGGTHLGMTFGLFGAADSVKPGVMFLNGSHTGGYFAGQSRTMTFDAATASFKDGGMTATAPNDRHLYPNYLGNNPGNQGRNYSHSEMVENPFVGVGGNTDKYLMIHATTGKPMEEVGMPQYKTTAFLTVSPISSACNTGGGGTGIAGCQNNDPGSDPSQPEDPANDPVIPEGEDGGAADPSASLGGCSSTGGSAGLASMLLIGLAAFIRRRRRA
jgi:uncharacterized protein (TIGR03382 family)